MLDNGEVTSEQLLVLFYERALSIGVENGYIA